MEHKPQSVPHALLVPLDNTLVPLAHLLRTQLAQLAPSVVAEPSQSLLAQALVIRNARNA